MKAWITDDWLREDASPSAKRSLNAAKDHPERANVPERYRKKRYGKGTRWKVEWKDDSGKHGKRCRTRAEAESYAAALEDDIRRGRYVNPSDGRRTFRQAAETWLDSKHDAKPSTINGYRDRLKLYIYPRWGNVPLSQICEDDINEWIGQLRDGVAVHDFAGDNGGQGKQPVKCSPRYIRGIVASTFGAVLRYAAKRQWIHTDPMANITLPKPDTATDQRIFLTYAEVEMLASAAPADMDATLIRFLAYVGCRPNEAMALQVGDLDFGRHRAVIERTWTDSEPDDEGHRHRVLGPPKTGRRRIVAWPSFLDDALHALTDGQRETQFVFRTRAGAAVDLANWRNRVFYPTVREAGLEVPGLSPYSLRHTFASLSIASGADVKTVQRQMGHKDASETLNTYADLWPDRLDDVMASMLAARTDNLAKLDESIHP